ncbi:glycosyltransferase family 39 protein [Candidatus Microgenomates bacterium]|nr:glycosyltransferase family 39 protein [Candidatus Microgenomates bacterium]
MPKLNKQFLLLALIIIIGSFLRFYKLDWGEGLFTHPDEYHIASSVRQLSFPSQMNPHFFNYGTVIIYLNFLTKEILQNFNLDPFLIGRFYSSLFSTLTIFVIYKISRFILDKKWALVSALLVAITPGLIQQAHFSTPESTLTFFITSALLFLLHFIRDGRLNYLLLSSVFLGLGMGTKVVAILFLPLFILGIIIKSLKKPSNLLLLVAAATITTITIFAISSPFVFLDFSSWRSSFNYEQSLAMGKIPIFYTRQFINTYPILFQLEKILPFTLGIPQSIFAVFGFIFIPFLLIRKFKPDLFIILLVFLIFFLTNALLFTKWTRFVTPTFPFFAIFTSLFLQEISKKARSLGLILTTVTAILTIIWSWAFFSIYLNHDVRIEADKWLKSQLPKESVFLVEGGNIVDLPLTGSERISLDFYHLEDDPAVRQKIIETLARSDYFLIQSRRVFLNHQRLSTLYPKTARFYDALFSGQLGFEQIKQFHSYPRLSLGAFIWEFPDEQAEETWSVFDHPIIRIFQKKVKLTKEDYEKIIEQ